MKRFGKVLGLAVLTAAAAVFMGCPTPGSGGDDEDDPITGAVYSGDEITFEVTEADSVNETETMLIIKYDRQNKDQLKGMTLSDVNLAVTINGTNATMPTSLKFELDPYSFLDNDAEKNADGTYKYPKEYKVKLPIGKKLVKGDVVKVKLNSATVTNAEADFSEEDDIPTIVISLIDTAKDAGYYTELCPNNKEYQTLITKKDGEKFPADDEQVEPDPDPIDPNPNAAVYSGEHTFTVTTDSTNDTIISLNYNRSVEPTPQNKELTLTDVEFIVTVNDVSETIKKEKLNFTLNIYGELTKETATDYKVDISLSKKVNTNDTVKVELKTAKVGSCGADFNEETDIPKILISLIDEPYAELAKDTTYKEFITKKNGAPISPAPAE